MKKELLENHVYLLIAKSGLHRYVINTKEILYVWFDRRNLLSLPESCRQCTTESVTIYCFDSEKTWIYGDTEKRDFKLKSPAETFITKSLSIYTLEAILPLEQFLTYSLQQVREIISQHIN